MSRRRKTRIKARELQTRHETNPFEDFEGSLGELYLQKSLYFVKTHLRQILIATGVLSLAGILAILAIAWQQNVESKSLLAFEKLLERHGGGMGLSSASLALEDISNYEKKFDTTGTRVRAALLKTKFLIENEEYEKAAKNCLFLARQMELPELKAYFSLQAGFLFERKGKNSKALLAYQNVAKSGSESKTINTHARFGELRMLLAGNRRADAKLVLQELLKLETERADLKAIQKEALALVLASE